MLFKWKTLKQNRLSQDLWQDWNNGYSRCQILSRDCFFCWRWQPSCSNVYLEFSKNVGVYYLLYRCNITFNLLQANPQDLLSTIQYINSFYSNQLHGEEQYWWTQFCAAVEYIKTMDYSDWYKFYLGDYCCISKKIMFCWKYIFFYLSNCYQSIEYFSSVFCYVVFIVDLLIIIFNNYTLYTMIKRKKVLPTAYVACK